MAFVTLSSTGEKWKAEDASDRIEEGDEPTILCSIAPYDGTTLSAMLEPKSLQCWAALIVLGMTAGGKLGVLFGGKRAVRPTVVLVEVSDCTMPDE